MPARPSLKQRVLRLLKEDEEFRYAVAGLIGLEGLARRMDSLEGAILELTEGQKRLGEVVAGLAEGQRRLEDTVAGLAERQKRLEDTVVELAEGQRRLEDTVVGLAEGQRRLGEAVIEMTRAITEIRREVGGLSATVGALSESGAKRAMREWLRDRGLVLEKLRPLTILVEGEEHEVDFYGEVVGSDGRRVPLYAEAKSALRAREVREFARIAREAERTRGEGIKAIIAYRVYEDAAKAAEEEQVEIIEA